jgi:cytochrome c1
MDGFLNAIAGKSQSTTISESQNLRISVPYVWNSTLWKRQELTHYCVQVRQATVTMTRPRDGHSCPRPLLTFTFIKETVS